MNKITIETALVYEISKLNDKSNILEESYINEILSNGEFEKEDLVLDLVDIINNASRIVKLLDYKLKEIPILYEYVKEDKNEYNTLSAT